MNPENNQLKVGVSVLGVVAPPIKVDLTKNDSVEDALESAIGVIDLGDAVPGNGAADFKVTVKVRGIAIPIMLSLDVV